MNWRKQLRKYGRIHDEPNEVENETTTKDINTKILSSKAQPGGAEGAQAPPPLSNQNIDVYFLSYSPTL